MADITRRQALLLIGAIAAGGLSAIATRRATTKNGGTAKASGSPAACLEISDAVGSLFASTQSGIESSIDSAGVLQTRAGELLSTMTTEQKVAQLFVITPEQLTGLDIATEAGELTKKSLAEYPVGGLFYLGRNITGADQIRTMLEDTFSLSLESGAGAGAVLCVDEEGGPLVSRVANSGYFDVTTFPNMADIGASGDPSRATEVGNTIGTYLAEIGFNTDLAPVADVLTNPDNTVIGKRAFSSDPAVVTSMVSAEVQAMLPTGTIPCVKHFPGHGATSGDSHVGAAINTHTLNEMYDCEFMPFQAAISQGVPMVMVGHIQTPNATGDDLPASVSPKIITDILRGELGFGGVVISDSLCMHAVSDLWEPAEVALRFIQAGGDLLLKPLSFKKTYKALVAAATDGTLTTDRLDESVLRILNMKEAAGLL